MFWLPCEALWGLGIQNSCTYKIIQISSSIFGDIIFCSVNFHKGPGKSGFSTFCNLATHRIIFCLIFVLALQFSSGKINLEGIDIFCFSDFILKPRIESPSSIIFIIMLFSILRNSLSHRAPISCGCYSAPWRLPLNCQSCTFIGETFGNAFNSGDHEVWICHSEVEKDLFFCF